MRDRRTLLVGLGIALVLASFLVPVTPDPTYAYEVERLDASTVADRHLARTLDCTALERPPMCALEHRVGPNGTLVVNASEGADASAPVYSSHEFVRLEAGFFEPNGTVANGLATLTLRPVDRETVLWTETRTVREVADPAKRAILLADGPVRSSERVGWDGPVVVRIDASSPGDEADYYRVVRERVHPPLREPLVRWGGRGLLFLGGVGLVLYGRGEQVRAAMR